MNENIKSLALFDFDGTLTTKDTFLLFIRFYHGPLKFFWGILVNAINFFKYFSGKISANELKDTILTFFFSGEDIQIFKNKAELFSTNGVPKIIDPKAFRKLVKHINHGDDVAIVSASPEVWIKPWAQNFDIEVIATKLNVKEGKITGKIEGKNCKGLEKAQRIKEIYDLNSYDYIYAYGDSSGDKEMLELATHKFYRKFN